MPSIASHSEESVPLERPLTRRMLHAVPSLTGTHAAVPVADDSDPVNAPTRRQVHRDTRASAQSLPHSEPAQTRRQQNAELYSAQSATTRTTAHHTNAQRSPSKVFNVEDYGPLSPESQELTSSKATHPIELREPTLAELMWLQEMRYHLRTPHEPALSVEQLAKAYNEYCTAWISLPPAERWDKTFAVTSIGIAIGDILVEQAANCHWMVSDTEQGPVFGVRDETARATYFPIDAVNRRWVAGKLDWVPGFIKNAVNPSAN